MLQQIEILLEGMNPYSDGALTNTEVAQLRPSMRDDETLESFVRGRIVGSGSGLWLLTNHRLLVLNSRRKWVPQALDLAAGEAVETIQGRYGATISMRVGGIRHALFAADARLSTAFAAALAGRFPASSAQDGFTPLAADEAAEVALWIATSRLSLQPALRRSAGEVVVLLREVAALRERGMLNDAECTALKGRLLEAA